jgi:hypothetical protein
MRFYAQGVEGRGVVTLGRLPLGFGLGCKDFGQLRPMESSEANLHEIGEPWSAKFKN